MATREYKGNAKPTKLSVGINATDLSFTVDDPTGWPTGGVNGKFYVTFDANGPLEETVLVQSQAAGICTIQSLSDRGVDDTTAAGHAAGTNVIHSFSATDAREANRHINNTTDDNHTQYMRTDGTRHDLTARHSAGSVVPTAAPPDLSAGATAAEGAGTTLARAAHVHGVPTGVPSSVGTSNVAGVSTSLPRLDHQHDIANGAIDAAALFGAGVVDSAALAAAAVTAGKIAAGGVSATTQVADAILTFPKFASVASTAFTPSWTGVTVDLGTGGNQYGQYYKLGRLVVGIAGFRLGTGGNVFGGGVIGFNLPASLNAADYDTGGSSTGWITAARSFDSSASAVFSGLGIVDPDECKAWVTAGASAEWDPVTPFNWDAGDVFASLFVFESTT